MSFEWVALNGCAVNGSDLAKVVNVKVESDGIDEFQFVVSVGCVF